jgi:transposase
MKMSEFERKREHVVALIKSKTKLKKMSEILGMSLSTIKKISARYNKTGSVERKAGSGRPKKMCDAELAVVRMEIEKSPKTSTSKLVGKIAEETKTVVGRETVRRALRKDGLMSRVAAVKPLLTQMQMKIRFETALMWAKWPFKRFKDIIFSDESRFDLYNGDGKIKVWRCAGTRYDARNCSPSIKHGGGSVMVWGCIGYNGVGKLQIIDGSMDSITYVRVLSTALHESVDMLGLNNKFVFQQDNAPCHTSKYTKAFFEENNIDVLSWPSQSPDLNPIENLWAYVEMRLTKKVLKTKAKLIEEITEIWNNIPLSYIRNLYNSIPSRLELVLRNKGGHIPY